jgi:glycosidase
VAYGISLRHVGHDGFRGVFERLDGLADLGVAAMWLSPVHPGPPGDFGYAVTDYDNVRGEYGSRDDLHRLVQEAHDRDIRVLLDVVPNHTSHLHPWFQDAEKRGPESPWWDWYDRDSSGNATHYFNWTHLPNLNFGNPDVRQSITESILGWVKDCDVDGFRVDVAWGIKQRCPEFWPEFAAKFRALKPDGLLIAEASARDPWYSRNGFDAAYDWSDALGFWAWDGVFDGDAPISQAIAAALEVDDPGIRVFHFLNNNDTGARFITRYGVDCYRVALAMLLTLPGLPCLYLGDEVGAEFEPYAADGDINWSDRHHLSPHVQKLVRLRQELSGLASRAWTPLSLEPQESLFGYLRHRDDGSDPVMVLLNFSDKAAVATIDPTLANGLTADRHSLIDVYNETTVDVPSTGDLLVVMPAWGIRVIVPEAVT